MFKFLNIFKRHWVVSLFGICALSIFVWLFGPLFAFSKYEPLEPVNNRIFFITVAMFSWLATQIWKYIKARKQNNQISSAISENAELGLSSEEKASTEEIETLKERLQKAIDVLKKSRLGGHFGQQYLYQLPWYILIGPSGAGKTTLLKNSDLKFPLADSFGKEAIRGEGGTRNCDWWFTEEAVLLDTAGRYVAQDSNEVVDKAAWLGFLDLLKKYRSRRPINGVIVAVSIKELLESTTDEKQKQAASIRQRIHELHERLNIVFPIYVVFTKCDQLSGFTEYFDDLDRDKRAQIWGMTLPLDNKTPNPATELFTEEFELLTKQLQNQLIDKLERERGTIRRNHIYTFPHQFNSINELVKSFIDEVFQQSRFEHQAMVRGIYFTSATQSGSPLDRIMVSLADNFGLEQQNILPINNQGKSFFINRLLMNVVFAESGLAGTNIKQERVWAWLQKGGYALVILLTAVMAIIWANSYSKNKIYIHQVSEQVNLVQQLIKKINPNQSDPIKTLELLDLVRTIPGGYDDQLKSNSWSIHFGLYQGDNLGKEGIRIYQKLLREVFLPTLMLRIETLLHNDIKDTNDLYQTLKVYIMLTDPEHYNAEAVRAWVIRDWEITLPPEEITNEQRQSLKDHLDALLEIKPFPLPRPVNKNLISETRDILGRMPVEEILYSRIVEQLTNIDIPEFIVSEKAGDDVVLALSSKNNNPLNTGISGLFTCKGYQSYFLKKIDNVINQYSDENWVSSQNNRGQISEAEVNILKNKIHKIYLSNYIEKWDAILNDIQIKPFSSQSQMIEVLGNVSATNSPLKQFLEEVDKETSMSCLDAADKSLMDKANDKLTAAKKTLGSIIGNQSELNNKASEMSVNIVREHFKGLHEFVQNKNESPSLKRSLMVLNELYTYLRPNGGNPHPSQIKEIQQVIEKIKLESEQAPLPINGMVKNVATGSQKIIIGGVKLYLNDLWQSSVLSFCKKAIQGKYPITNSPREISYDDFTQFFGPNGMMEKFFTDHLASSVDKSGKIWKWNTHTQEDEGISLAALRQFQIADSIKSTFFSFGKPSPSVSFVIKPISMSKDISQIIIDIDGQKFSYEFGPITPASMKWPGPKNTGQIRIQLFPIQGKSGTEKVGPWALMRLFDEAHITKTADPTIFIVTFNIQGREAKFELQANSAINPFQLSELQSFQCLQNL